MPRVNVEPLLNPLIPPDRRYGTERIELGTGYGVDIEIEKDESLSPTAIAAVR
jgi:hypothetical protein